MDKPGFTDHPAIVPVPRLEMDFYDWYARHEAKVREAAQSNHDLIFIGDSITHLFEGDANIPGRGERVWQASYSQRKAMNLGFGWDRTQNVLWRLDHGELEGQTPRLVVLLIGTNNLGVTPNHPVAATPEQIVEGNIAICQRILGRSPQTRILLLGILPRGTPEDPRRQQIACTNRLLGGYCQGQRQIQFMDLTTSFADDQGQIHPQLMADATHPAEPGYRLWADLIEPVVREALDE